MDIQIQRNLNITSPTVNFVATDPPAELGTPQGKIVGANSIAGGLTFEVTPTVERTEVDTLIGDFTFPDQAFAQKGSQWKFSLTVSGQTATSGVLTVAITN